QQNLDIVEYRDRAIGLARIFGIKLPLNFNSPYKAKNIIDFWRRWHMTLSRFLRDYLYVPLGGNRLGRVRRYINLAIVMLLGGLWHGAAWNFVIWGGLHGLYLIINHGWRRLYPLISWPQGNFKGITTFAAQTATLLAVIFAWTFFRSENWLSAQTMMMALTGQTGIFLPSSYEVSFSYVVPFLSYFGVQFGAGPDPAIYPTLSTFIQIIGLFCFVLIVPNTQQWLAQYQPALNTAAENIKHIRESFLWRPNAFTGACFAILFLVCLGYLLKNNHHEFIYFQF
ncbi:MAG: MBOAT family O-acyltransferase, partial [Rhodospirillaceae bacterium]